MAIQVVDAIQDWGKEPSWEIDKEKPHSVALQSAADADLYEITIVDYNAYGKVINRKMVATCSRHQIRMSGNLPDYGIYNIPKA